MVRIALLPLLLASMAHSSAELNIPAFTAYSDPNPNGVHISSQDGVSGWTDPSQAISWFGEIKSPGILKIAIRLKLPKDARSKLKFSADNQSRESTIVGTGEEMIVPFKDIELKKSGYTRFTLQSENPPGSSAGDIQALILGGPASEGAHFNLDPRRNAASVHLSYPTPKGADIQAFYCEATGVEDPVSTYYMACGFQRGYFGMQVNGPAERRIIFSVWDTGAGAKAKNREEVAESDQTRLLAKGDGVTASAFGNEGTGGHSHLVYPWKTGERQRFMVTAKPAENGAAIFSGYWFHPAKKAWLLMATFQAPKAPGSLSGLYSFSENFNGANGHLRRKAFFGNQWIRLRDGAWHELTDATFSYDVTGKTSRLDRFMGVENGQFFLSNGGFVPGCTGFGERAARPSVGAPPPDITKLGAE